MATDYTVAEIYSLPSKALIYEKKFDPQVRLRSMTVRDEMKRQSQSSAPYRVLCEIIDNCILDKLPMSVYDMCMGDYEYLLHKLRIVSYGNQYKMVIGCPHCNSVHEEIANLDELEVKEFDVREYQSKQTFKLPASQKEISLNMQTPRLLDSIDADIKEFKRKNKSATIDPSPLITLQHMIEYVDGAKMDYVGLENFIQNLPARDYNFIVKRISELNNMIGLNAKLDLTCSKCGGEVLTYFRYGEEFFGPTTD